ncbi:MAG TPA: TetR/AcrR family transcriptional regulator [Jatrophihabitans sp.]|nr:TetR/AcrR family transcriptional regulator [Jatrophihabitans sp.]
MKAAAAPSRARQPYDLESLLAVVVDVFNERGYDGTSMEDLSRRLGISKSAIYHHVQGKEELLRIALDRALNGLDEIVSEARALDKPAIDKLEYLIRGSVRVLQQEHSYVALLLRVRGSTQTGRAALDRRRGVDNFVAELVRQAQQDGDFRTDIDAAITARLLFGMVNSLAEWYRPTAGSKGDGVADAIAQIAFDGLRPRR